MKTFWNPIRTLSFFLLLILAFPVFESSAAETVSAPDLTILEEMAVQSGGRIKPYVSFAQEVVVFITGKEKFEGRQASAVLFEWLAKPEVWENKTLIPLPLQELRQFLGLSKNARRVSPKWLSAHINFLEKAEQALLRKDQGERLTLLETKMTEAYEKMNLFYNACEGKIWAVLPPAASSQEKWASLYDIRSDPQFARLLEPLSRLIQVYLRGENDAFQEASSQFLAAIGNAYPLGTEIHYQRLRPFHWAWRAYLAGFIVFLISLFFPRKLLTAAGFAFSFTAFLFHTYGFILRCLISGRPPVSNMYESVVWVSWGVVLFSTILLIFYRSPLLWLVASAVAALGLILADSLPAVLDPSIAPLVPVLRNNFWLTIHVLTITLSYGAFALALGLGHLSLIAHVSQPIQASLLKNLTEFLYRSIQIGVILLASGTILGGVWANYSWGRFWGWDPKETWALIALLGYLAILHGRYIGWVDAFGLAVGSIAAFLGILMAWYGVNFVLATGLHSYGFGGGGLPVVTAFILADLALVGALVFIRSRQSLGHKIFH